MTARIEASEKDGLDETETPPGIGREREKKNVFFNFDRFFSVLMFFFQTDSRTEGYRREEKKTFFSSIYFFQSGTTKVKKMKAREEVRD